MKAHKRLQHFELTEVKHLKVHGRTTGNLSPLTLFWTGSALELNVQGSELWLEVESRYELYESWISVLVNGVPVSRQMLAEGRNWICLFRGMNPLKTTNVRIVKEVQAMSADPGCVLQMHAVRTDGEFLPVRERPRKIEFIGDSITSGEGAIGLKAGRRLDSDVVQRNTKLHVPDRSCAGCGVSGHFPERVGRDDELGQQSARQHPGLL